jgi:uncharacterized protein YqeY
MDNLVNDKIDMFIMSAMKAHDTVRTETLRSMKTAFMEWRTSKANVGKTLDEAVEIQILNKMVKQRQESIAEFEKAGRTELAEHEKAQLNVIQEFLPQAATEEDILKCFNDVIGQDGFEPTKNNMGVIIKTIKAALPTADGGLVAQIVKSRLQ